MIRWMFKIRNNFILIPLYIEIAWLRFKCRKVEMTKSEFIIYILFILLVGICLGMVWRANQVEPNLKAQIATFEKSKNEWVTTVIQKPPKRYSYF